MYRLAQLRFGVHRDLVKDDIYHDLRIERRVLNEFPCTKKPKSNGQTLGCPTEILAQSRFRSRNADWMTKHVIFNFYRHSYIRRTSRSTMVLTQKFHIKNPRMNTRAAVQQLLESREVPGEGGMRGE